MPKNRDHARAALMVDRFVARFEASYRPLVHYAALPLALTPELVHYLRQQFLPATPWVAEVDLLLSELCREAGYETYLMDSAVRAYGISRLRAGREAAQAARLLLNYARQTRREQPDFNPYELQAQRWTALAYLDDGRATAAQEIAQAYSGGMAASGAGGGAAAEFLRLSRLVRELAPEFARYPDLVAYAQTVTELLRTPERVSPEQAARTYRVDGAPLPSLTRLAPTVRPEPVEGPSELSFDKLRTNGMEFVWIPAGRFLMGSPENEAGRDNDEGPQHEVVFKEGFWMGKYPVTQAEWQTIMGNNPSQFKGARRPVECVSWDDCQEFLKKLNDTHPLPLPRGEQRGIPLSGGAGVGSPLLGGNRVGSPLLGGAGGGLLFRLPSEAEWEYACRAGTQTAYSFGDDPAQLGDYAWYSENSGGETHPVGQLKPNAFGLCDMHGNVWEWCADAWHENYDGAPTDGSAWERRDADWRVLRGGSYYNNAKFLRCAVRTGYDWQYHWFSNGGFRLVCSRRVPVSPF